MQMHSLAFDVSHTLAGGLVLISFMMLYQDRLYSLLNVFALHALVLALSVAWQAFIQDAPHLYVTAAIALVFKAIVIPVALHRIVKLAVFGFLLALFETATAKMRVFRVPQFLGAALMLGLLGTLLLFVSRSF